MSQIRTVSNGQPLAAQEDDDVAVQLILRARGMGLLTWLDAIPDSPGSDLVAAVAAEVARAGIGRRAAARLQEPGVLLADERRRLMQQLEADLRASPLPGPELTELLTTYDLDWLGGFVGASQASLRRYAAESRVAPDDVASRIHYLALVNADLAGSYNAFGRRRWWRRPRTPLGGLSPQDYLGDGFDPEATPAATVADLARALVGAGGAT